MLTSQLRCFKQYGKLYLTKRLLSTSPISSQSAISQTISKDDMKQQSSSSDVLPAKVKNTHELFSTSRVIPVMLTNKESVVLPFDDVPGPKSLKYLSTFRHYLSDIGTQITAGILTIGLNIGTVINTKKPLKNFSALFDEYGPVVRFISPVGNDIVLINHPDHIQKVYALEGDCPVRSTLDSLEKYRVEHRNHVYGGLYTLNGEEWSRQRSIICTPLHNAVTYHMQGIDDICEGFSQKVYNMRTYQDEVPKDLYEELHKWAFDSLGLILFSKKFSMLNTDLVYSQCDMSWMYYSLEKATDALIKCETGLHWWKIFSTPAWYSLIKYCDSLDSLIGKYVLEAEQTISSKPKEIENQCFDTNHALIYAMLAGQDKMNPEDVATVIMDMLLIGVNTITSSTSFLLYYLAKYQRVQKLLYKEIQENISEHIDDLSKIRDQTPYLQVGAINSCGFHRLVPPIPVLTRILPKNITLDKYNIPRGTLIIMSTQDASIKERNYEDAKAFYPERWLQADSDDYHTFASIPFGYGPRKCLGQNIAEHMISLLTVKLLQKYKLDYHYGDVKPSKSFIVRPHKALKIRFIDRI